MQRGKKPYSKLGKRLLSIRKSLSETLHEVSGAVELDTDIIDSYEKGETRPSEDVLGMLISHFEIKGDEADELWELAGYTESSDTTNAVDAQYEMPPMPTVVVVPMDNKTIYTDKVNVSVNSQGVVMSFMQESIMNGQSVPVSRVGMSIEHAKKVAEVLNKTIQKYEENKPKNE
jgi:transcriptional regulator with XRE-family HTH domain